MLTRFLFTFLDYGELYERLAQTKPPFKDFLVGEVKQEAKRFKRKNMVEYLADKFVDNNHLLSNHTNNNCNNNNSSLCGSPLKASYSPRPGKTAR